MKSSRSYPFQLKKAKSITNWSTYYYYWIEVQSNKDLSYTNVLSCALLTCEQFYQSNRLLSHIAIKLIFTINFRTFSFIRRCMEMKSKYFVAITFQMECLWEQRNVPLVLSGIDSLYWFISIRSAGIYWFLRLNKTRMGTNSS